ncbi:hypothetical protein [Peribacillus aracenensis]|uniref:hypothetical protein n=1 Tax=Peribacillus aracenensis TaxID=2976708 RepID=UPI0021A27EC7|nr:hypothetical protein [Peribacillus sp. BBB004]
MKAVGAEKFQAHPGKGRILIKVKVFVINRTDIISRVGKSGYMANPILVNEVSGEVVELMAD